jgi:hypothetical protein
MDMLLQRLAVRMAGDAQADLPARSSDCPHHGRSIIGIRPVPAPFVGPPTRRIGGISVFFPLFARILKHLVRFRLAIGQGGHRLQALGIDLERMTAKVNGRPAHVYLTGQGGAGFAFAYPAHQQHDLGWAQPSAFKNCAGVEIVDALALTTALADGEGVVHFGHVHL